MITIVVASTLVLIAGLLVIPSSLKYVLIRKQEIQQVQLQQQSLQQRQFQQINENKSKTQIYGCADFGKIFHCDPFLNEIMTYKMVGNWSMISPVVNDNPLYVNTGSGEGPPRSGKHQHDNKALEIVDESREFVEIANNESYNTGHFSVSFNIKKTTSSSAVGHAVSHSAGNATRQTAGWFFDVRISEPTSTSALPQDSSNIPPSHTVSFGILNSASEIAQTKRVPLSESSNKIVGTFDGIYVRLYKDGMLVDHIGSAGYCSSCNRWSGIIDDLRLYNKTLTENEIQAITLEPSSRSLSSSASTNAISERSRDEGSGIVGHWPFDGNLNDVSGAGNHGKMLTPLGSMAFAPDGRLFYTEKNTGAIRIMKDDKILQKPFASVSDVYVNWEQGLLGITLDPNYLDNGFLYLYYTAENKKGTPINRVVRFTDNNNTGTDFRVLLDNIPASRGYHSGGALAFGPDDKLYISVGDATEHEFAQDPSILIGKILRIDRDGTIPKDNPYPNSPVYTTGHRNMYGLAFDWKNGTGILTENGDQLYDEINLVEKGGNYGFPLFQPANIAPELSNSSESIKPLRSYFLPIAPTQAIYYTGYKYPFLHDKFLFGTYTGSIYALTIHKLGTQKELLEEDHIHLYTHFPVNSIAQSSDGNIYFGGFYIYKLDDVNVYRKIQDTFPVVVTTSPDITINDIQGSDNANYLYASLFIDKNKKVNTSTMPSSSFISFKIPTTFLPGIRSMTYTTKTKEKVLADFAVEDSDPAYTVTRVQLPQNITDTRLFIDGSGTRNSAQTDFEKGTSNVLVYVATNTSGIVVDYSLPSAMRNIKGPLIPVCGPPSGSVFPIGDTIVKCTATDKAANNTSIATFIVRVIVGSSHR